MDVCLLGKGSAADYAQQLMAGGKGEGRQRPDWWGHQGGVVAPKLLQLLLHKGILSCSKCPAALLSESVHLGPPSSPSLGLSRVPATCELFPLPSWQPLLSSVGCCCLYRHMVSALLPCSCVVLQAWS